MWADSLLAREVAQQTQVLADVLTRNPALADVRDQLRARRQVRLVGIGSSRHVASYGVACFDALSAVPAALLPSPGAGVHLPALSAADGVVLVSQSGRTPALLQLARTARDAGALVVSVTNEADSPLQALADASLQTYAGPERVVPATKSVTASMLLLRALAAEVEPGPLVSAVAELLAREVAPGPPYPEVVVASGFAAEAVSDEVALKLAEVTGTLAVAETVVDYLHGPAAVPARVLALLDPTDPNSAAVADLPDVLAVDVPQLDDASLGAVLRVVLGQCLCLGWAAARGLDPDDPRGLQKVTMTL